MLNKLKSTLIILILSSISAIISFMDDPHIFLMFPALIAEIYAICELIKWWKNDRSFILPTAIISTICIIPTAVAMIYQKKLFVSACLAFALIAAIMFRVYFKRKKKAQENDRERIKWYIPILAIILLIPTVAGSLLWVDGIRSIGNFYFPVIQLVSPNIRGYEYYSSGKFTNYRYGGIAAEYLPKQQELSDAVSADFYHTDLTLIETCFLDTNVQYFLRVEYPSDVYTEKKKALSESIIIAERESGFETYLIKKEQFGYTNCMYYFACVNDTHNTIIYLVIIDDTDERNSFLEFDTFRICSTDIWQEVCE